MLDLVGRNGDVNVGKGKTQCIYSSLIRDPYQHRGVQYARCDVQRARHVRGDPVCLVPVFFGTHDGHRDVFR